MGKIALIIVCCAMTFAACRDRPRFVGPESLVFDVALGPDLVNQTVTGLVQCATCPPNATTMLIDLYLPQRISTEPVATVGFEQLGAYSITAMVPYGELLEVRATLFTAGGIRKTSGSTYATEDDDVDEATAVVNLALP